MVSYRIAASNCLATLGVIHVKKCDTGEEADVVKLAKETLSLRLGPVAEVGMTAASSDAKAMEAMEGMSLKTLSLAQVSSALRAILRPSCPLSQLTLARADWARYFRDAAGLETGTSGAAPSALASLSADERENHVLSVIRQAANAMHLDIQDDTPLMEAGIDSLSAVEFRGKISQEFRSVRLPSTLMFDHPTLKATALYIAQQMTPQVEAPTESIGTTMVAPISAQNIALKVQGAACNLPGSRDFSEVSCSLWQGTDGVTEMPFSRWDADEYYDPAMPTGLEMYVRHAAFIQDVEFFDAQLFNITKIEAEAMDPQQRHLLETAYGAFMDAGFKRSQLMGKKMEKRGRDGGEGKKKRKEKERTKKENRNQGKKGQSEREGGKYNVVQKVIQLQSKSGNVANLHLRQLNQHISEAWEGAAHRHRHLSDPVFGLKASALSCHASGITGHARSNRWSRLAAALPPYRSWRGAMGYHGMTGASGASLDASFRCSERRSAMALGPKAHDLIVAYS
eukprot:Skav234553  [mRNA]  locus=scaffold2556:424893:430656:+ [translate_table: standard]